MESFASVTLCGRCSVEDVLCPLLGKEPKILIRVYPHPSPPDHVHLGRAIGMAIREDTCITRLWVIGLSVTAMRELCRVILQLRDDLDNPHVYGVFNGKIEMARRPAIIDGRIVTTPAASIDMMTATATDVATFGSTRRSARLAARAIT